MNERRKKKTTYNGRKGSEIKKNITKENRKKKYFLSGNYMKILK